MPKKFNEESSNSELVRELVGILKEEVSLFETFLGFLEQQQHALVKNDIGELDRITDIQREKIIETRTLTKKREELIRLLSLDKAVKMDLTISSLIETVTSGQAAILGQLRDSILGLNEKIMRVQSQNEMLINRSRENIMKTVELLGRLGSPNSSYQSNSTPSVMQTNLALDRRA